MSATGGASRSRSWPASADAELRAIVGEDFAGPAPAEVLADASCVQRGSRGRADAWAAPASAGEVAAVMRWCSSRGVPMRVRGGGTGLAGGAVPDGGVVLDLRRLSRMRSFDPALWRMHVEAGVPTAVVRRRARESGLLFPVDPGAAEQSTIGGNVATGAGGPHAFGYGAVGAWVTGVEVVVPPGELLVAGGPVRKDVGGLDLRGLMVGSEGVLGVVTSVWLRLVPAPDAAFPVVVELPDAAGLVEAVLAVLASGLQPVVLDYIDSGASSTFLDARGEVLLLEADGSRDEAERVRGELLELLGGLGARVLAAPREPRAMADVWRAREGIPHAVVAQRGGKWSEDIGVPVERLGDAVSEIAAIGVRHGLPACSWGHAGDGNLHATWLLDPSDAAARARCQAAAEELFAWVDGVGGTPSGEHGIGVLKREALARRLSPAALRAHEAVRRAFDPDGILNRGVLLAAGSRHVPPG